MSKLTEKYDKMYNMIEVSVVHTKSEDIIIPAVSLNAYSESVSFIDIICSCFIK